MRSRLELWNYEDGTRVASWQIREEGSLCDVKFIPQTDWIVITSGSDEALVYDVQTSGSDALFYEVQGSNLHLIKRMMVEYPSLDEQYNSPAVQIAVHSSLPYILTSFGRLVVLWDWAEDWETITFKGRNKDGPCATAVAFHPTDSNICSNLVVALRDQGKFFVLKIVTKGENKGSKEGMQMASVSAKRSRTATVTPITTAVDEPASVSKKTVVEVKAEADCDSPEWEKRIQQVMSDLELKHMEAVKELREEHSERVQKLEVRHLKAEKRVHKLEDQVRNLRAEREQWQREEGSHSGRSGSARLRGYL
ncbi:hypothetical protein CBR_g50922 [Chara braunii]|uniref:Uncharacterized protein n=1 Tax=Chara braunii TaxID=69332 RepID=A0A388M7Y2_CHABU|nr:hypothetical protein CBR_g50922 [Chara braunii]|eukprot:GBG90579.1 hypothetical protein CBR_g50922 [Chara braunii]